jgi:hypothetical protein
MDIMFALGLEEDEFEPSDALDADVEKTRASRPGFCGESDICAPGRKKGSALRLLNG